MRLWIVKLAQELSLNLKNERKIAILVYKLGILRLRRAKRQRANEKK